MTLFILERTHWSSWILPQLETVANKCQTKWSDHFQNMSLLGKFFKICNCKYYDCLVDILEAHIYKSSRRNSFLFAGCHYPCLFGQGSEQDDPSRNGILVICTNAMSCTWWRRTCTRILLFTVVYLILSILCIMIQSPRYYILHWRSSTDLPLHQCFQSDQSWQNNLFWFFQLENLSCLNTWISVITFLTHQLIQGQAYWSWSS